MKKLISLLLVLVMSLSLLCTVSAASPAAKEAADALHELGLFQGVGTNQDGTPNYDLDRTPNRMEAVTMLVRLLGKEEDAKAGTWNTPFTDVADWAKPYVGYAYANKLTNGISATAFGGTDLVTASQYITFVLRALDYDSNTDFKWNTAWELSDKLGITNGQYNSSSAFTRGDVAIISNNTLSATIKGTSSTLRSSLGEVQHQNNSTPQAEPKTTVFSYLSSLAKEKGERTKDGYSYLFYSEHETLDITQTTFDRFYYIDYNENTNVIVLHFYSEISDSVVDKYNGKSYNETVLRIDASLSGVYQAENSADALDSHYYVPHSDTKTINADTFTGDGQDSITGGVWNLMTRLSKYVLDDSDYSLSDLGFNSLRFRIADNGNIYFVQ